MARKILILEDDPLVRQAIRLVHHADSELVFAAEDQAPADAPELVALWRSALATHAPDLALIDVKLWALGEVGLEVAAASIAADGAVPVVLFSNTPLTRWIAQARTLGARGFLDKLEMVPLAASGQSTGPAELDRMATAVLEEDRDFYLSPRLSSSLVEEYLRRLPEEDGGTAAPSIRLESAEADIIRLYALGYTRKEIQLELNLTERSFESWRNKIHSKFNVHGAQIPPNPKEGLLIAYAVKYGLVELPF